MNECRIRLARAEDLDHLPVIEAAAAALFPNALISAEARAGTLAREQLQEALDQQRLWIAERISGEAVGFALAAPAGDSAFLLEVDVHPHHQRQGLGRRLIQAVLDWAEERRFRRLMLTTFADLPWNAPFYQGLGFRILEDGELTPELATKLTEEKALGLKGRVAMAVVFPAAVEKDC